MNAQPSDKGDATVRPGACQCQSKSENCELLRFVMKNKYFEIGVLQNCSLFVGRILSGFHDPRRVQSIRAVQLQVYHAARSESKAEVCFG
jgi:hypothetical protein